MIISSWWTISSCVNVNAVGATNITTSMSILWTYLINPWDPLSVLISTIIRPNVHDSDILARNDKFLWSWKNLCHMLQEPDTTIERYARNIYGKYFILHTHAFNWWARSFLLWFLLLVFVSDISDISIIYQTTGGDDRYRI